ncbi:MAG: SixA phosphatase family protein [Paracoccaceae bacterium]
MRHAKSSWDRQGGDHARPLSNRGRNAATTIGHWLAAKRYVPDIVLCSNAERTAQTWARISAMLVAAPDVQFEQSLYLATAEKLFQVLLQVQDAETALILAHNPGIAVLASALADRAPAPRRFDDYPTAATTILYFETDSWNKLTPGTGQVVDFVVPRDLGNISKDNTKS